MTDGKPLKLARNAIAVSFVLAGMMAVTWGQEREDGDDREEHHSRQHQTQQGSDSSQRQTQKGSENRQKREGEGRGKGSSSSRTIYKEIPPASTRADISFEKDVKPILLENCTRCHGAKKQKGDLRLDTKDGIMSGAEDGPIIKPGNGAGSLLVRSICGVGVESDEIMPPKDDMLTKEEIGIIRAWIDQGAKFK